MEVDFAALAAVQIHHLQRDAGRAKQYIFECTQAEMIDLSTHWRNVCLTVLVYSLADHVANVIFGMRLHPCGSEGLYASKQCEQMVSLVVNLP